MNLGRTRHSYAIPSTVFAALILACSSAAPGQTGPASRTDVPINPRIQQVLGELEKVRKIDRVALSPDGKSLAWVVDGVHGGTEIMVVPAPGSGPTAAPPQRVTLAEKEAVCDDDDVAWSPDSASLAFLSNCPSRGQSDIYLIPSTALSGPKKPPRRITHLHGFAQGLQWSPDGKRIGFLYVEGATRRAGALAAMKPPAGVIGEDGIEIQRVAAVDVAQGELHELSPAALHVFEFDWSPDSAGIAYVAAAPPGENNWWVAQLYAQHLQGPTSNEDEVHSVLDPAKVAGPLHGLQIAVPRWSPDGKYIAFIGGLMSDQGATGGDLYILPAAGLPGGQAATLIAGSDRSIAWFTWLPGDQPPGTRQADANLLVSEIAAGSSSLAKYQVTIPLCADSRGNDTSSCIFARRVNLRAELMHSDATLGDGRLEGGVSLSAAGDEFAFIRSSFGEPPEVYSASLIHGQAGEANRTNEPRAVSHYNDALKPRWGKAESVQWTSDGYKVQGWLLYPSNFDPTKKYPMVVIVHGGPASAVLPQWPGMGLTAGPFSALGYFAFEPNPRGSFGEGETFTAANRKDFGYGDLRDILAGLDAVTSRLPVDPDRIGITGWSYGGFTTMFAVTQTQRFRAAVAGAGISNWQSYYGENSIDQWMVPYFGATVYDDPAVYAKSSAINFIQHAKTPTLVVVGDRDGECPAPQSFEFWHALRARHVATQLVVYPNEGHGFVDPAHRLDVLTRALNWFEKYMPARDSTP